MSMQSPWGSFRSGRRGWRPPVVPFYLFLRSLLSSAVSRFCHHRLPQVVVPKADTLRGMEYSDRLTTLLLFTIGFFCIFSFLFFFFPSRFRAAPSQGVLQAAPEITPS
ncbi:hypothetical protein BO70DRAFT_216015 [Aspergillus heteromorphus CBS 117.55]|uniref:Transmembrane protein n=1 Tax=Aspergillus heteromorphus CBS 117.55 TaxID=1448321 RepID=A0A317UQR9_9EURO|nr:uncharacterized protein BO70DRAFT_216015 [Aspergillus heteromorphus CBS 117.55]PWY64051.1 hypothetical protein BO70DRAFT_216015 [Aspergillus heteromorphus CBS 117.55]